MADEQGTGAIKPEGSARGRSPIVFVCDASAEAERITASLLSAGYVVGDVPLSLLCSNVGAQRPNVIVLDVDREGVLEELAKLRRLPGSGAIDFVYVGGGEGVVRNVDDALANDGSAFFLRPVEIGGLVRKIEALTGGPAAHPSVPPPAVAIDRSLSTQATSIQATHRDHASPRNDRPSIPSLPAPGLRAPGPPLPMSTTSLADLIAAPRSLASFGTVSPELQQLLADAELRAEAMSSPDIAPPTPEEEIEGVLPADVLASLDEPIDGDEDEEPGTGDHSRTSTAALDRDGTGGHGKGTTSGGSRQQTTGSQIRGPVGTHSAQPNERRVGRELPPRGVTGAGTTNVKTPAPVARPSNTEALPPSMGVNPEYPSSWHPPPSAAMAPSIDPRVPSIRAIELAPSLRSPPASGAVVLGPSESRRFFAEAVARRASGALCFESEGVVRRIVMRDGDLVAAASGSEQESLVHFLASRGELPRDEVPRLAAKIPPYGRHAGAALVAHGWLRQDQMWQMLRAHAEWIAATILRLPRATAELEPDPPGRLRSEPSVFGAVTGAAIFVELVRRAVSAVDAIERLGGESSRMADGPNHGLLAECNLSPQDLELLHRARGGTVADLLGRATDNEIAAVAHALVLLGILEMVPAPDFGRRGERTGIAAGRRPEGSELEALDEDAIRSRVRARLELVEEGDYFAVLGVSHDATGYEIRRAFVELRRTFEPSRILTPRLHDLADDLHKIIVVFEEAYDILRDGARRERYRRAIDARPDTWLPDRGDESTGP